jgi:hypothetical protein
MNKRHFLRIIIGSIVLALSLSISSSARYAGGTFVKGAVSNANRTPLSSAWVIVSQDVEKGRYFTGDDGKFYIGDLDDGVYELVVEKKGSRLCKRQIALPENNRYDIALPCAEK